MAGKTKVKTTGRQRSEFIWGWLFILPTVIGLIVLNIIPIFQTIYQSFFKTGDFGRGNIFVGLENYQKVFADKEIWQALLNTFKYAIVEVPFSIIIALVLAVFLNRKMIGRSVYRTIIFLPMVAAPAAVAMVWRWLFNSDFGLINNLFHLHTKWISDPRIAVFSIAVIGIWSIIGYNMVLFISGLQEIPHDYYEAAEIDGASIWQKIRYIDVPSIVPVIVMVFILDCGKLLSSNTDKALVMQTAGNIPTSDIIGVYVYNVGLGSGQFSYTTAIGLFINVINFIIIITANQISKKISDVGLF